MTGLDRIHSAVPLGAPAGTATPTARSAAGVAIGEIGHRVLAWVGQSQRGQDTGSTAWAATTGGASSFRPDAGELARRGDVYDLNGLAGSISQQLGGTPMQEGELRRALGDFTRQAVVQLAGLSGAAGDRQVAGLRQALSDALTAPAGEGVDGVIGRLHAATQSLTQLNGPTAT